MHDANLIRVRFVLVLLAVTVCGPVRAHDFAVRMGEPGLGLRSASLAVCGAFAVRHPMAARGLAGNAP